MSEDLCPCGCGHERAYPVGITLAEARLILHVFGRPPFSWLASSKSLLAKVGKALAVRP